LLFWALSNFMTILSCFSCSHDRDHVRTFIVHFHTIHSFFVNAPKYGSSLSNIYDMAMLKKERGKMACQRSMTQSEVERKDGMPKKHDPHWGWEKRWRAKEARPKKNMSTWRLTNQKERKASHIQQLQKEREVIFGVNIIYLHIFHFTHLYSRSWLHGLFAIFDPIFHFAKYLVQVCLLN